MPQSRSRLALDALSFFVADVQTGFGPFIAVYLATLGWSPGEVGQALAIGTAAAAISQIPGGALVDRLADKRIAVATSGLAVAAAALAFAVAPSRWSVMAAEVVHSFGSAMLGPAVAAVSLAVVGRAVLGERLGRNSRFAALGNGFAAAVLGGAGKWISARSVFWLTALFMVPGVLALFWLPPTTDAPGDPDRPGSVPKATDWRRGLADLAGLLAAGPVLAFAGCIALFHLGNAALLPLASGILERQVGASANLFVAACVVGPQAVVALIAPWVGRTADRRGVRLVLAIGFAAVPARALALALATGLGSLTPYAIVAAQVLDGAGAATFGVLVPVVAADLTRGSDRFNLCLGVFGVATTIGATAGNLLAGTVADAAGARVAFLVLAACGAAAVAAAWFGVRAGREDAASAPSGGPTVFGPADTPRQGPPTP